VLVTAAEDIVSKKTTFRISLLQLNAQSFLSLCEEKERKSDEENFPYHICKNQNHPI
jgi:hypothetical protein